jgi:hypothetical protein
LFGAYVLNETGFTYGYASRSGFKVAPGGITAWTPGFDGKRTFAISVENGGARLNSGSEELLFSGEGVIYSENGKVLRRWRRLKDE